MKYIQKTAEPAEFAQWKKDNPGATYDILCRIAQKQKKVLQDSLLKEQGYICCYCERQISANNSHIEHFKPKGNPLYANLQLDYSNLHCSCNGNQGKRKTNFCGGAKEDDYSSDLISPTEVDCASHFNYRPDGSIYAVDKTDTRALYTISLLNLNFAFLRSQRKAVLENFMEQSLTIEDLDKMEADFLLKSADGKYKEFYSMIEAFLK